jgi:hypothetical protein
VTATLDEEWKKLTAPLGKEAGTTLCFWECHVLSPGPPSVIVTMPATLASPLFKTWNHEHLILDVFMISTIPEPWLLNPGTPLSSGVILKHQKATLFHIPVITSC